MRTSKQIREELLDVTNQIDEVLDDDKKYAELSEKADNLEDELAKVLEQEARRLKVASFAAGSPKSSGEEKELKTMADRVNLAKSIVEKHHKSGLEAEVQQIADEEKKESGIIGRSCYQGQNIVTTIPGFMIKYGNRHTKATIDVGTEGTDAVQTTILGVTPALEVNNIVMQAGATVMSGLRGDIQITKGSTLTMAWEGETDAEADATATLTKFTLAPKRLGGKIPVSWQFLKQSAFAADMFFKDQLRFYIESALDAAVFHGATNGPTGIVSETGVNDVSDEHASEDAYLTWATIVELETQVGTANALKGRLAYAMPSKVAAQMKTKFRNTGTSADQAIIDPGATMVNGYPYYVSNNIVDDYTTDSDQAYIFFGNFQDVILGFWGGIDILEDPYTAAANATTVLHSNLYCNSGLLNGASFSFANNIKIN